MIILFFIVGEEVLQYIPPPQKELLNKVPIPLVTVNPSNIEFNHWLQQLFFDFQK